MPYVLSAGAAVARAAQLDRTVYNGLRPVLVGPRAGLHRFSVTGERASLGAYDPLDATTYTYPDKVDDSIVDLASVKLFSDDARLNYFEKFVGVDGACIALTTAPNRVRAANFVFKTGNGVDRSAAFYDRDVKVGDVAYVRGVGDDSETYELTTTVTGFAGEVVAASTGSATADSNNAAGQSASASVEQVDDTPINDVVVTANGSAYLSSADGYISRTYTVTVTQSSTGGDATTGRLRVRSSDGLDDLDNVVPAAFSSPTAIGTKGLTGTFTINPAHSSTSVVDEDDLVVGQAWTFTVAQLWTAPVATAAGTYTGTTTTTYIVTVTTGGRYADTVKPKITITSTNGYDRSGPTTVTATATPVAVGSYGVTVQFSQTALRKGDQYYIVATAAGEGALKTLILQDDIDVQVRGNEVDLRLFAARDGLEIPTSRTVPTTVENWSYDADGLTVNAAIAIIDSEFTDGGVPVPIPLDSGSLYVEYREWLAPGQIELVTLTDPDDIQAALGTVAPENPIAWHASFALACTAGELLADPTRPTAATTDRVFCVALDGDPSDTTKWQDAIDLVASNDEAYGLVPITTDSAIQQLFVDHVESESTDEEGFYRVCWLNRPLNETGAVVSSASTSDHNAATATVTVKVGTSPPKYLTVTASANAKFITNGVRAGDVLRINYDEDAFGEPTFDSYVVASVMSETTLELRTGPTAQISPARQFEIWRTYTKTELVSQLTSAAAGYASSRVFLVFPDEPSFGGTVLDGTTLCAALAGLAGSVPSHQGLKNVGLPGFDDMSRASRFFTGVQLDVLAAGGVFVVSQTPTGDVYVRNATSTDPTTASTREEMITRNADMVRKAIQSEWAPYVGSGNVVSNLNQLLDGALQSLSARFKAGNYAQELGTPVGGMTLSTLAGTDDPTTVEVTVNVTGLALPLNQLVIQLPVTV